MGSIKIENSWHQAYSANPKNISVTISDQPNGVLVSAVSGIWSDGKRYTSVVFGSAPPDHIGVGFTDSSQGYYAIIACWLNPPVVTANVKWQFTATPIGGAAASAWFLSGVSQPNPIVKDITGFGTESGLPIGAWCFMAVSNGSFSGNITTVNTTSYGRTGQAGPAGENGTLALTGSGTRVRGIILNPAIVSGGVFMM